MFVVYLFSVIDIDILFYIKLVKLTTLDVNLFHYYKLIYHCHHFHYRSDRSDGVILPSSVEMIARPPRNETGNSDLYHQRVNDRCGSGIGVVFASSHEKPGQLGYTFWSPALN